MSLLLPTLPVCKRAAKLSYPTSARRLLLPTFPVCKRAANSAIPFGASSLLLPAALEGKVGRVPRQETADYALIETVVGLAVFAKRALPAHSVLSAVAFGPSRTEPWRHSLQIGADEHAEPQPTFLRYLSHSCDPNLFIDLRARQVITLRPISPGDELTIFYPATEWRMQSPFACACGAARCLGEIRGAADLPPAVLKRYRLSHVIAALTGAQAELG